MPVPIHSSTRSLKDYAGKVLVLVCVPSLDTPVCDMEVRRFNTEAAALSDKVRIVAVSRDLNMGTAYTVTGLKAPSAGSDAATKTYVDSAINGLSWKAAVKAAGTGNVAPLTAASAGNTLDGVALLAGDRILLKSQTDATANGIYVVQGAGIRPAPSPDRG